MKMVIIVLVGAVAGIACNNNTTAAENSQLRSVDSAAAAAPDTIKPVIFDSVTRRDSLR